MAVLDHKQLVFMHIPKTAGTTLRQIIVNQYGEQRVFKVPLSKGPDYLQKQLAKSKKVTCIRSHHPFGLHQVCSGPFTYITMLRDPIDRVISHYFFLKSAVRHPMNKVITGIRFEDFLSLARFKDLTENVQTRMAAGKYSPNEADLELAKVNLTKYFSVVGLTDKFDETVFLLKETLGWGDISYTKRNVTSKRPSSVQLPNRVIEMIKEKNHLDIELYQWAKKNFENRLSSLDEDLKQKVTNDLLKKPRRG